MAIKNVALIGANGTLGPHILAALKASQFTPYVLNRASSKSTYPDAKVLSIPDDLDVAELTALFKENSINALVIAIAGSHVEPAKKLIDAAFDAGVETIIPADFGSCDSADDTTVKLLPLMEGKQRVRDYLIDLSQKERKGVDKLTWTSIVTGHMFDYGLTCGLLKFDVKNRTAYLIDGGDIKFSASNLPFIADATVAVLKNPEQSKNKVLYVHSHWVTQKEVLAALEKATGEKWKVVQQDSDHEIEEARPKMLKGDPEATEEIVAVHGLVASDWKGKEGFANELLGLEEENLEEVVQKAIKDVK